MSCNCGDDGAGVIGKMTLFMVVFMLLIGMLIIGREIYVSSLSAKANIICG